MQEDDTNDRQVPVIGVGWYIVEQDESHHILEKLRTMGPGSVRL